MCSKSPVRTGVVGAKDRSNEARREVQRRTPRAAGVGKARDPIDRYRHIGRAFTTGACRRIPHRTHSFQHIRDIYARVDAASWATWSTRPEVRERYYCCCSDGVSSNAGRRTSTGQRQEHRPSTPTIQASEPGPKPGSTQYRPAVPIRELCILELTDLEHSDIDRP